MKQIKEFIIKKAIFDELDEIQLIVEIDAVQKKFAIKIKQEDSIFLADFPRELEFILRANEVLLSKKLNRFLKKLVEKEIIKTPFVVYSRKSPITSSTELQAA